MGTIRRTISISEGLDEIAKQLEAEGHYATFSDLLQDLIRTAARKRGLLPDTNTVNDSAAQQPQAPPAQPPAKVHYGKKHPSSKREKKAA